MAPTIKQPGVWIASLAVLVVSIGLEFYGHACGFLITPDSLHYLSAAKSFSTSGNFLSADGSHFSSWPPLFPIILSFFRQPQNSLAWINVTCKIILLLVLLRISDLFIQDPLLKIIFFIASMIGVHIMLISVFVWSELIFMTLIFLNAYFALNVKKHKSHFYLLLVTGFLVCVQRNAGLFWIGGVCLWLLLDSSSSFKKRIIESGICFLLCTSGMWAWNIYNTFFIPANFSFYEHDFFAYTLPNLKSTLSTYGKMIIPMNGTVGMVIGVLFFLAGALIWKVKGDRNIQFLGITLLLYSLGFLIMPGHLDVYDMDRYFSVVTPIVYLFILLMVQEVTRLAKGNTRILVYTIVFLWLCYPLTRTFVNVKAWHERSRSMGNASNNIDSFGNI